MKKWKRFEGFLEDGDCHVHTSHVDGENSVIEMCGQARKNGLRLIAFTEHVRKAMDYDFSTLLRDVEKARKRFPGLMVLVGCEAKVLPDGLIDAPEEVLKACDIVIASFHNFPPVKHEQTRALKAMLKNPEVDVWGHPGTFLNNCNLNRRETEEVIKLCKDNRVLIERSLKYENPENFLRLAKEMGARMVVGSDAHSVREVRKLA